MPLSRGEVQLLIAACLLACLLGGFAGYFAYVLEEEHHFHGGILPEDVADATWDLAREAAAAFALVALATIFAIGVLPLLVRRLFLRRGR